jgi:GT2 family glycosyltransferase
MNVPNDSDYSARIVPIIVLYNLNLEDSITFLSLSKSFKSSRINQKLTFYVYDNSRIAQSITHLTDDFLDIVYFHDATNSGISAAFNYFALFAQKNKFDWLILLDQDTEFPINAFNCFFTLILKEPGCSLFVPQLITNKGLVISPSKYFMRRGFIPKTIKEGYIDSKKYTPFNSGILIKVDLFLSVGGYDEKVPLDYSDFAFMQRVKKNVDAFYVLELKAVHNFSGLIKQNFGVALFRYDSLCKGMYAQSNLPTDRIISMIVLFVRASILTKQYKNFTFLKKFFNASFSSQ